MNLAEHVEFAILERRILYLSAKHPTLCGKVVSPTYRGVIDFWYKDVSTPERTLALLSKVSAVEKVFQSKSSQLNVSDLAESIGLNQTVAGLADKKYVE